MAEDATPDNDFIKTAAEIVAAYVTRNSVPMQDLPGLIRSVHETLGGLVAGAVVEPAVPDLKPAIPIKKSVTDEAIICLEDGKRFKSLKRHLMTAYGMTPQDYRTKWGLAKDYPMVAPAYAAARSNLARSMGLGRKAVPAGDIAQIVRPEPGPADAEKPKRPRGRAKAAA